LIDIAAGFFARLAVGLLDLADELIALPLHLLEVVVAQSAPALPGLPFDLLPVAFDLVPVHRWILLLRARAGPGGRRNKQSRPPGAREARSGRGRCAAAISRRGRPAGAPAAVGPVPAAAHCRGANSDWSSLDSRCRGSAATARIHPNPCRVSGDGS